MRRPRLLLILLLLFNLTIQPRPDSIKCQKLPLHTPALNLPFSPPNLHLQHRILLTPRELIHRDPALLGRAAPRVLDARGHGEVVHHEGGVLEGDGNGDAGVWVEGRGAGDFVVGGDVHRDVVGYRAVGEGEAGGGVEVGVGVGDGVLGVEGEGLVVVAGGGGAGGWAVGVEVGG